MHTWITTRPVNTEKFQKAIFILEALSRPKARLILQVLKEHRGATFLELMIYARVTGEELELYLEQLCETGVVKKEEAEWQPSFFLDETRLSALAACAKALARGSTFSVSTYSRDVP